MKGVEPSAGDIVVVTHRPLDDPWAEKARPALVVSGGVFNRGSLDVIVVALSSTVRVGDKRQIVIEDSDSCFGHTGLKVTSAIKCGVVFAYPKSMIRRTLGAVSRDILSQVRGRLIQFLTCD